jgi:chromosome segregation ATPase
MTRFARWHWQTNTNREKSVNFGVLNETKFKPKELNKPKKLGDKNMKTENLNSQIETKTTELTALETEQRELSQSIADAANAADSVSLITLAHRRNNLPVELLSARVTLERLFQQRDEERLPYLQDEARELSAVIPELQARLQSLQTELNIASGRQADAAQNVKDVKLRISERGREIEALLHQARNTKITPSHLSVSGSN